MKIENGCLIEITPDDIQDGVFIAPDNVTSIGQRVFAGNTGLTSIFLPEVTCISGYAFHRCTNLSTIFLPKVTDVGWFSFSGCIHLSSISLLEVTRIDLSAFSECTELRKVYAPKVTVLRTGAFSGCIHLKSISLPELTHIQDGVFHGCSDLVEIFAPKLVSIGVNVFHYCRNLLAITLSSSFPLQTTTFPSLENCNPQLCICIMNDPNSAHDFNALQLIREPFPISWRPKIIFKSIYDEVVRIKQKALERLHLIPELNPCRHPLVFFAPKKGSRLNELGDIPLVKINEFLGNDDKRVKAIMKEIEALPFPRDQQGEIDIQQYQTLVDEYITERIERVKDAHLQRLFARKNVIKAPAEPIKPQDTDESIHKKPRFM